MTAFSTLLTLFLATPALAKTINVFAINASQGKNATFSPRSIVADVGDLVVISPQSGSDTFVIVEGQTNVTCAETSFKRLALRAERPKENGFSNPNSCPLKTQVTSFTIPDTNPLVVFSAVNGQCLDGMILDINFRDSPYQANITAVTIQTLLIDTATAGCIDSRISRQPTPQLTSTSTAQKKSLPTEAIVACVIISVLAVVLGIAGWIHRRKRIERFEQFIREQEQRNYPTPFGNSYRPPIYSAGTSADSHDVDLERQPLTGRDVEKVLRPT